MIFPILGLFIGLTLGFLAPVLVPFALASISTTSRSSRSASAFSRISRCFAAGF